jgi:hypothetical protein
LPICAQTAPATRMISADHTVACHLY